MPTTRGKSTLREIAGTLHRELRITLTRRTVPDRWVFIVGCYNSGTELLMHLLGSHPQVSSLPVEGQFLTDQFKSDYEYGLPRMWVMREDLFRLTEEHIGPDPERLEREWLMRLDRSKRVFVEKSPPNAARTRWLQEHFPNAHFIALVRNGYAVAEGIRRKAEPFHLREGWPIHLCARQWARSNQILVEDAEHLDHVLWVTYEDLVEETAREVHRIADFLGIERPDRFRTDREWAVHEREEPIRNMNPESIERLSVMDIVQVNEEAEAWLRHFDYPVIDPYENDESPPGKPDGDRLS